MTAGSDPICSAATYVPASASQTATTSTARSAQTRPRPNPRVPSAARAETRRAAVPPFSGSASTDMDSLDSGVSGREPLTRRRQVVQVRVPAGLGAVGDAELAVRVRQVELDGLLGHPQLTGDAAVGVAL